MLLTYAAIIFNLLASVYVIAFGLGIILLARDYASDAIRKRRFGRPCIADFAVAFALSLTSGAVLSIGAGLAVAARELAK